MACFGIVWTGLGFGICLLGSPFTLGETLVFLLELYPEIGLGFWVLYSRFGFWGLCVASDPGESPLTFGAIWCS